MKKLKTITKHCNECISFGMIAIFGVLIRSINITQAFVDHWSWRQTDVAMVARNFNLNGFNIFYPQIDWAGAADGYIGMELPLVPYLAALLYMFFGEHEWVGRSISILFYLASLPLFYLFIRRMEGPRVGLYAVAIYTLAPLCIFASRSFMSDMASMSLAIMSLYPFSRWLEEPNNRKHLLFAGFTLCLGILTKPSAAIVGLPMLYLTYDRLGILLFKNRELWLFAIAVLGVPALWYVHASHIAELYAPQENFGSGLVQIVSVQDYLDIFERNFFSIGGVTFLTTILMVVGLFVAPKSHGRWFFHWWLLGLLIFVIVAGHGNHLHEWYQLIYVPVCAVIAARALDYTLWRFSVFDSSKILRGIAITAVFLTFATMSWWSVRILHGEWDLPSKEAGVALQNFAPADSLILVATDGNPSTIYYSNRKGWIFPAGWLWDADGMEKLERCRNAGAEFLIINKYFYRPEKYPKFARYIDDNYPYIKKTDDFVIIDLRVGNHRSQIGNHCRMGKAQGLLNMGEEDLIENSKSHGLGTAMPY
jgi:hypothetical protein